MKRLRWEPTVTDDSVSHNQGSTDRLISVSVSFFVAFLLATASIVSGSSSVIQAQLP